MTTNISKYMLYYFFVIYSRAAKCIQRNIRKFVLFRDWHWWKLYTRVKPLLNTVKAEDELKAKDAQIKDVAEKFEKETQLRKDYETKCVSLLSEKNNLTLQLQAVSNHISCKQVLFSLFCNRKKHKSY